MTESDGACDAFKAPTTPNDPVAGVLAALDLAAAHFGQSRRSLLAKLSEKK